MISARWPHSEFKRVDTRADFLEALERERFDLILSDYTMPGFDGVQALALAHARCPEIPFLFVSGTIGEDTAIEALKSGATDYVLKHRLMRLIPAVDRALRETAARAESERAEEAMRQSEYKYRILFENLGDAAFLVDVQTGKILDLNQCACSVLCRGRGHVLGSRQSEFLAVDPTEPAFSKPVDGSLIPAEGARIPVKVHSTQLTLHGREMALRLCHKAGI